jgi:hypothetical protein
MRRFTVIIHTINHPTHPHAEYDERSMTLHIKVQSDEEASILFLLVHNMLRRYPPFERN